MENSDGKNADSTQCVRVAVNVRPLITSELLLGCTDCISVVPGEPQVQIGSHAFTYDYVYHGSKSPSTVYDDCVAPLVDALFHGYNATVLAYGQTGSGKTYTMGTNYTGEGSNGGIIPKVMENIFKRVEAVQASTEFLIRVSFIEIFKEEVFDLLDPNSSRGEAASIAKPAVPTRVPIQIRETVNGGITLAGVTEAEVKTKEEMASYLSRGSLSRATGSTNMNSQSSRSHAIFTITMEQKNGNDILCAKLHLVDLAGSERAKRTGADGMRLKEGIHINKGLLALGNVISALGDEKKRKEGGHVPYRDSKLTRLLQDSLGGNSKTVMIACVSPADTNAEETLNTLKYANRARNIQNKAIINRDPVAAQVQALRNQVEQLQAELLFYRGDASGPFEELQILKHKISLLESSNAELQREVRERRLASESLMKRAFDAQVEKDQLIMKVESIRNGKSWDEIESNSTQDYDLVKSYVSKIQELERELLRLKSLNNKKSSRYVDWIDEDDDGFRSKNAVFACGGGYSPDCDAKAVDILDDDTEDDAKELEHSSLQQKLDMELKELDKKLEQKEAEMKRFNSPDTAVLRHHYEKKLLELEHEKKVLQKEIEDLKCNLSNIPSSPDDGAQKLKEEYLQKLNALEAQVAELKKKQDAQAQLLKQKQKSDEASRRLQDEIQRIKSQKVHLQQKIKQESEQFRLWKASREKEVLQLKKEGRRTEYEMHKLLALNQRQKMVLQRKTEEASMATKRLKELLESRKASSRENTGTGGANGPGVQALMQLIEHELEVTVRVHEVRAEYERQMEERASMAKEISRLKEENDILKQNDTSDCISMSPGARKSRIFALENMLAATSTTLVSMASQLSEAEERERVFGGKGRWNQVRSLVDAKNLMNYLFNVASSSRCLLRDKEVSCREKDMEIRDLKEKVVSLSCSLRQMEMQKAELLHQGVALKQYSESGGNTGFSNNVGGHKYDLRKPENRRSTILLEDMDLCDMDSDEYDVGVDETDDEWVASGKLRVKKRNSKSGRSSWENSQPSYETPNVHDNFVSGEAYICCTCSKLSSCKTSKCQCRSKGNSCGRSCGCIETKCANRGLILNKEPAQPEIVEGTGNGFNSDEPDSDLASQGAELLQSALAKKSTETNSDHGPRKPLADIGNTEKSHGPRPNQRKKWRKSTILLVSDPPPHPQPENPEATGKQNNSNSEANDSVNSRPNIPLSRPENAAVAPRAEGGFTEADITLKIPRAMRKAAPSNGGAILWDRNAGKPEESVATKKESDAIDTRSPIRPRRTSEKENHGR
ncbi:kinesin-like protein KIN-4C isoform X2 [Prosopis cineraria]|uniref:kinesin-like protein KIN-4C isoform X2 n=1 Tax=Prosopis cineraria TaxID=364024 RepID=UPI00240EBAA1|nr:kinesin-like protein KIN-4C isoform X2 [Prosopis cineraria]